MTFPDCLKRDFFFTKVTIQKRFPDRNKSFLVHSPGLCQSSYLSFVPMLSFTHCGAGAEGPGEQPDLCSSPADLMSHGQFAHPKEAFLLLLLLSPALALVCQTFLFCQLFECLSFLAQLPDSKQMLPTVSMSLLFSL